MSRSAAEPPRILLALAFVALLLGGFGDLRAQEPEAAEGIGVAGFPVELEARIILSRLQSKWLEWLTAINAGDSAAARAAIDNLTSYAGQVAMPRLPELALAATVRALEAGRNGQFERAAWALEAAERLDEGLPEAAFGAAAVARIEGSFARAALEQGRGTWRALRSPDHRPSLLHAQGRWAFQVLILALLAIPGLQMVVKGGRLYRDLLAAVGRYLPAIGAHPVVWAVILWPLVLPNGWLWLALYWTALFWIYGGAIERALFVTAWVAALGGSWLLDRQPGWPAASAQIEVRTIAWAAEGRLRGSMMTDVANLRSRLPESPAVMHAAADLQRRLGQCETARLLYAQVVRAEPDNFGALADMGACLYDGGVYDQAIDYLQLALERNWSSAPVQFNLSQALSEVYRFDEAESALRSARAIDAGRVNRWMRNDNSRLVIPVDRGLVRSAEILGELRRSRAVGAAPEGRARPPHALPLMMAAASLLVGGLVFLLLRRAPRRSPSSPGQWFPGVAELARRTLLPGVPEAEAGEWARAWIHWIVALALLTLPWADRFGPAVPWGLRPGPELRWLVAVVAGLLYLGVRLLTQRRRLS